MQSFFDEILRHFPELAPRVYDGDEELPHVMLDHLVDWLLTVAKPKLEADVAQRVVDFDRWCMAQHGGQTAADDIPSIAMVGLREELFGHDALLPLIPLLMTRIELLANHDYLISWVGEDRYNAALRLAKPKS